MSKTKTERSSIPYRTGTVQGFKDQYIATELLSIGITLGSHLKVMGKSPFGGSFRVEVDGRSLAMGLRELNAISLL